MGGQVIEPAKARVEPIQGALIGSVVMPKITIKGSIEISGEIQIF